MAATLMNGKQIRALLAGKGHPKLSEPALTSLLREGMPQHTHDLFDPVACLSWYVGKLRREAIEGASKGISDLIAQRMDATVDDLLTAIQGKPVKEIELLLGRHFRKITSGLAAAPSREVHGSR